MGVASALFKLADNGNASSLASQYRANRFHAFTTLLRDFPNGARILDVGGTPRTWIQHRDQLPTGTSVVLLNSQKIDATASVGLKYEHGDARDLKYCDGEFDVCFSNSLIEHFETFREQETVAAEIRRVARSYFVQTPNRLFPIEPHSLVPGWQFAPVRLRAFLLQQRGYGWMPRAESAQEALLAVKSIRLLNAREMRQLFPDGALTREKIGPLTKSFVVTRQKA